MSKRKKKRIHVQIGLIFMATYIRVTSLSVGGFLVWKLHLHAYSAYLDPWCTGVVLLRSGDLQGSFARCSTTDFVSQSGWWCQTWRAPRTSLASREGGCGVAGRRRLEVVEEAWRYC